MQGRADKGLILTTGSFTVDARKEATRDGVPPIELVDGDKLIAMFERVKSGLKPMQTFEVDESFFNEFRRIITMPLIYPRILSVVGRARCPVGEGKAEPSSLEAGERGLASKEKAATGNDETEQGTEPSGAPSQASPDPEERLDSSRWARGNHERE